MTIVPDELRKGRNQLASTVILGHTVKHIYNSALPLLLAMLKVDPKFEQSATQYGVIAGAGRGTSGATTMVAGYLGERFADRAGIMLFISLSLMGISYFLLGVAPSYWWIFAVMLLVGIGPSLYHPPAIASLSRKFPDKIGFAISLHGTGGSIGEMLGPVIIGLLTAETFKVGTLITVTYLVAFEWHEVLKISVIPALFFASLVYLMMRNISTADAKITSVSEYFSDLGVLLRNWGMIGLISVTALRSMGQSAIQYFLPLYLLTAVDDGGLGKDELTVGFFLAGAQVAGVVAQPIMGWLSDNHGRKVVLVPAMTLLGILYITLSISSDGYPLLLNILFMGAFVYSLHTIFIAAAMDVALGKAQSTVVSLIYGASFIGTVSPIIAGLLVDAFGLTSAFVYSGIIVLSSTVVLIGLRLPKTMSQEINVQLKS